MTIKQIIPFGDSILRKKAKQVGPMTPKMLKTLDDMAETLYATEGRAGLAAPQVGILRRMIVMDCGEGLVELINPEILEMDGEQHGPEACLSFPGYIGMVRRADHVKIRTLSRQGEDTIIEAEGFVARCIQHEMDHLDGILFIDHVKDEWLFHEQTNEKMRVFEAIRIANRNIQK